MADIIEHGISLLCGVSNFAADIMNRKDEDELAPGFFWFRFRIYDEQKRPINNVKVKFYLYDTRWNGLIDVFENFRDAGKAVNSGKTNIVYLGVPHVYQDSGYCFVGLFYSTKEHHVSQIQSVYTYTDRTNSSLKAKKAGYHVRDIEVILRKYVIKYPKIRSLMIRKGYLKHKGNLHPMGIKVHYLYLGFWLFSPYGENINGTYPILLNHRVDKKIRYQVKMRVYEKMTRVHADSGNFSLNFDCAKYIRLPLKIMKSGSYSISIEVTGFGNIIAGGRSGTTLRYIFIDYNGSDMKCKRISKSEFREHRKR